MQIALRRNLTEEQAGLDATFHLVRLDVVEHHRVLDGSSLDVLNLFGSIGLLLNCKASFER